jgi:hypothetical protein
MLNSINKQQSKATKSRGGGLPELLKATLLLDKVANPDLSLSDIIELPDRECNKHDPISIRNRFNYLTAKQKKHPSEFWTLYSEATLVAVPAPYHDTLEAESDDEEQEPHTPPAQSRRQRTPDTATILSTPPPSSKKKKNMSGSARKNDTSSASPAFAYNTMFATLEEAQDTGV